MRFNKLDLNLLVALDAMLSERSVSRAAQRLHITQSAMSNSLGRLRDYFEDELLVQVGRKLELTPRAQTLQDAVRDVLMRIDTSVAAQPKFDCSTSDREFTVFISDYSMAMLIPRVLALAQRQQSTARFKLLPQLSSPARALERGEADLLIIPKAYCSPDHPTDMLFSEDFVCTVWRESSHARIGLSLERYVAAAHAVQQPVGTDQPSFENLFVQRYGVSRRIEVSVYSFAVLPFVVVGTELIATVHARLARQLAPALPISILPVPLPIAPLEQVMQWHKYRSLDPGLLWLRELIQQACRAMNADVALQAAPAVPDIHAIDTAN